MPRAKPWLKLWVEWIHDPKMLNLTWTERGMWCGLLSLAQQCNADGYFTKGEGLPMSLHEIATCLHISNKEDRKTLGKLIDRLVKIQCLHWNSTCLVVTHFAERQALTPSETKEAIRERVQRYREKQKEVTEKPLQSELPLSPTPPITNNIEGEGEGEGECNGKKPVTSNKEEKHNEAKNAKNVTTNPLQSKTATPQLPPKQPPKQPPKPGKKTYGVGNNVYLTDEEYSKLVNGFGEDGATARIHNLSTYIGSKGDKYKSHYLTILHWETMHPKDLVPKKGFTAATKPPPGKIATQEELNKWNQ